MCSLFFSKVSLVAESDRLFSVDGFQPVSVRPVVEHFLVHSAELVQGCAAPRLLRAWYFLRKSSYSLLTPWATPTGLSSELFL